MENSCGNPFSFTTSVVLVIYPGKMYKNFSVFDNSMFLDARKSRIKGKRTREKGRT